MKCEVEEIDKCNRKLKIEIPLGDYQSQVSAYYKKLSHQVKMPGFRPGKIPQSIMEKRFGPEVKQEVLTLMVSESINQGIQDNHLHAIGEPSIVEIHAEEGTDITVTANVEVLPEFSAPDISKLEVPLKVPKVSDEQVEQTLESYREQKAVNETVTDRGIEKDDLIKIDFESTCDGKPYENSKAEDYVVQVGGHLIGGFDDKVLGMQIGETRSFSLTLPDDHPNKEVAGKEVDFTVTLKGIQVKKLPELDDAFAQTVDPDKKYENLDALKAGIRAELEEHHRKQARVEAQKTLADKLADVNPIDVPEKLVQEQIKFMVNKEKQQDAAGVVHEHQTDHVALTEEDQKKHREQAVKLLQQELVINKFSDELAIEVSEPELDRELQVFMSLLQIKDLKKMKQEWAQSGALLRLHNRMRRDRTLEKLLDQVQLQEEMVDSADLKKDN
ncbi:putative Trigger factor [Nitrospina gracilis 3/211]|uniref:Trigger factor n=1 Tax=Nitrospina gracilis (strain 3/211) TaxID=1266370 RepID=M1Z910_NITG3|nr:MULTISPECIES: trigger factor [Nitrospina]MCF8722658.1 trigger factor [Nitrospina sp. Nb-3]CCQ89595.1 putative Trigger factor [Nitrospina gracilis 3/211]